MHPISLEASLAPAPGNRKRTKFIIIKNSNYGNKFKNFTIFFLNLLTLYIENRFCSKNTVDRNLVKGKILVCDTVLSPSAFASFGGAVGVVMQDAGVKDNARSYPLPASYLGTAAGGSIKNYMASNRYFFSNTL